MNKTILTASALLAFGTAFSQERNLPNGFSPEELQMMKEGNFTIRGAERGVTTPPSFPVRTMAQWEEVQTLTLAWTSFPSIQAQIVDAAQEECEVLIICSDSNQVKTYLNGAGVPLTNVSFLEEAFNSIWIRDYGAHTVYKNDVDSLLMVEWIYNRPTRPDDDALPNFIASYKGIGLYSTTSAPTDLVNTGGNWVVDGFGTAFASKLILDENDAGNPYGVTVKSETDIDNIMSNFMGINRYIKMETLPYDLIHHIDMHMKLMDEENLLFGEYPTGVADGPQMEANLLYVLNNFNSVFGTPYKVTRIPMPPSTAGNYPDNGASYRTYANNVIVNKTVIVPTYRQEYDTTGLRILGELMPGYTIVPIDVDNSGANLIAQSGAIHCITNLIGVDDPLLISHQNLPDTYDDANPYTVNATIKHKTGIANATLYWSLTPGTGYTSVPMSFVSGSTWTGNIPAQPQGSTVYYYIHAQANSGKQQVRPMPAPAGYFDFDVLVTPAGISETTTGLQNIFPNPASAITCIPVNSSIEFEGTLKMYDVFGKLVETIHTGSFPRGESRYFIHADKYAAGAYYVVLQSNELKWTQKVMIR
ncbi:MAG: agmatine deiminase family protein [Bacteroidota bacterium]